jgi:predicted dehydrogenase
VSSSSRIRIGIAGLNFGAQIVQQLRREPARRLFEIAAVADLDRERADRVAARHRLRVATWPELLADPSIEAIGLFCGPAGRADLIRAALRAGKHVLTTKPFELSVPAAAAVLAEAEMQGRVVHLNSPSPVLSPELAQIAQWRTQYDLGRLVGLRAEAWGSYQETADGSWYDDPRRCPVAPIFRLGIYLINDIIRLAGSPAAIQVAQSRVRTGRPTPDNALLTLTFPDGALASIYASFCVDDGQPYKNSLAATFERGAVYRNCGAPDALGARLRSELALVRRGRVHAPRVQRRAFRALSGDYQWQEFARAVRAGATLPGDSRDALLAGLSVIAALPEAARTGRLTPLR